MLVLHFHSSAQNPQMTSPVHQFNNLKCSAPHSPYMIQAPGNFSDLISHSSSPCSCAFCHSGLLAVPQMWQANSHLRASALAAPPQISFFLQIAQRSLPYSFRYLLKCHHLREHPLTWYLKLQPSPPTKGALSPALFSSMLPNHDLTCVVLFI